MSLTHQVRLKRKCENGKQDLSRRAEEKKNTHQGKKQISICTFTRLTIDHLNIADWSRARSLRPVARHHSALPCVTTCSNSRLQSATSFCERCFFLWPPSSSQSPPPLHPSHPPLTPPLSATARWRWELGKSQKHLKNPVALRPSACTGLAKRPAGRNLGLKPSLNTDVLYDTGDTHSPFKYTCIREKQEVWRGRRNR